MRLPDRRTDTWPTDILPNGHLTEQTNKKNVNTCDYRTTIYPLVQMSVRSSARRPSVRRPSARQPSARPRSSRVMFITVDGKFGDRPEPSLVCVRLSGPLCVYIHALRDN